MKKIKLLNYLMIAFLIIGTFGLVANLVLIILVLPNETKTMIDYSETNLGRFTPVATALLIMLLIKGIQNIQRALSCNIKYNYFNSRSAHYLQRAGILLILFSILCIAFDFSNYKLEDTQSFLLNLMNHVLVMSVGIALTAVSDLIKKGEIIEQENLLTI